MSDFTYDQMKNLFETLADRIDKSTDTMTRDEVVKLRAALDRMHKTMDFEIPEGADPKEFIAEFFKSWRAENPNGTLLDALKNNGDQTIIAQLQALNDKTEQNNRTDREEKSRKNLEENKNLENLGKSANKANDGLNEFGRALRKNSLLMAAAAATGAMVKQMGGMVDSYRAIKAAGDGQVSSIQEMNNAADSAHMSVQEFADALTKGSAGVKQLGGLKYANLVGNLTKTTNALGGMAMNFNQRADAMSAYLDIQSQMGNLRSKSEDQMVSGIQKMVKSTTETASILGITREEALKARAEQARDQNMNTIINSMGYNPDDVQGISELLKNTGGDSLEKLFKQRLGGVTPTGDAATLASTDGAAYQLVENMVNTFKSGGSVSQKDAARMVQQYANENRNSGLSVMKAQYNLVGTPYDNVFGDSLRLQNTGASLNTEEMKDPAADDGTNALLGVENATRAAESALRSFASAITNGVLDTWGPAMKTIQETVMEMSDSVIGFNQGLQQYPTLLGTVGAGLMGLGAAVTSLVGIIAIAGKGFALLNGAKGLAGMLGMARGAGAAAGAAGGAAGGAGAAGGTFIQRAMSGIGLGGGAAGAAGAGAGAGAAGAAKGLFGSIGKVLSKAALPLAAGVEALGYLGDKEASFKNLAKSGLKLGGGLVGGALAGAGSFGTASLLGGVAGYTAGDWLGETIFGPDDLESDSESGKNSEPVTKPVAPSNDNQTPSTSLRSTDPARQPAKNTEAEANAKTASGPNQNIEDLHVTMLKSIKDNTEMQLELMREEISLIRSSSDRQSKLMEEGNRFARTTADNSL